MFSQLPENASVFVQGAGRGIGLALARALANAPGTPRLHVSARRPAASQALNALVDERANRIHVHALDVTDELSIRRAADEVARTSPRLDMLLVCAGVLHDESGLRPEKRLADIDPDNLAASFAVNAAGPLLMLKHFQRFLAHGERAVYASLSARIGSIGDNGLGGWYAYRGAKAAQNMFTRTAAIELRRRSKSIICVGLHPGTTDTALSAPFQRNVPEGKLFTPMFAAERLLTVLDGLTPDDSGEVFAWDGERIPP